MLDKNAITDATNKSFSKFSDVIKNELHVKLAEHPKMKAYANDYDSIQNMKAMFAQIGKTSED